MTTLVTLWDGRRGYFYLSRFAGTPIFQPVDDDNRDHGNPEVADAEDHELREEGEL